MQCFVALHLCLARFRYMLHLFARIAYLLFVFVTSCAYLQFVFICNVIDL